MNEYLCGVKLRGESGEEVVNEIATIDGFFNIMANTESITCQSTNVIDADIASISYFALAVAFIVLGYFLGKHGKKTKSRNN